MSDQTAGPQQPVYPAPVPGQYAPAAPTPGQHTPAATPTPQPYPQPEAASQQYPQAEAAPQPYPQPEAAPQPYPQAEAAPQQYAPAPQQYAAAQPTTPQPHAPVAATAPAAPTPPSYEAQHAWIDGYEPGNPWQSRLCFRTEFGTVSYPLTPNTMPELLEGLVIVAQEQQGITGDLTADTDPADDDHDASQTPTSIHDGRAARLTGWAVVHDLWEREDPKTRYIMGGVVVLLLLLGFLLS
ncbi:MULTISPECIES: hypothetical protein [unclassified Streptomyces]|uniref:hypothetical protein n=1 Tax=Streptomyces sp. NPDC127129 TaxID=3345373 RepID=UPI00363BEA89